MNETMLRMVRASWGRTIPEKKLATFFRNFGYLLRTGMSIPDSLVKASAIHDEELGAICRRAVPKLLAGGELSKALEPDRHRFPELTIPVLEVGEVSGTLEEAANRLADAFDGMDTFQNQFTRAKIEPAKIVLGAVFFRLVFSGGSELAAAAIAVALTALEAILVIFLLRLAHRNLYRWPKLHRLVDKIHLAIPHVGAIERAVASARWARSFATMWHAGVPISYALEVASRSSLNAYYEYELMKAADLTRQGKSIRDSLESCELTPRHLLPILSVGHESARFGESLDAYVGALEDEAVLKAQQETAAASLMLYLVMGFVAAMIALSSMAGG